MGVLAPAAGQWCLAGRLGGCDPNASSNTGAYGPTSWTGALAEWGASACSLSIAGGLITLEDLQSGHINHALAMAIPNPRAVVYASPAQRTDGWSLEPASLPEGAHLRLDPNLDLAALHLPKLTLMMAEAAQRYGIVVRDTARDVTFYGQDPTPTGTEPYIGAHGYYEGKTPQQLLASFPWSHLQLLKMELRRRPVFQQLITGSKVVDSGRCRPVPWIHTARDRGEQPSGSGWNPSAGS